MKEIVQFKNGKYGIRKRNWLESLFNIGGSFKDFNSFLVQWRKPDDNYFYDCQLESVDEINDWLLRTKNDYVGSIYNQKQQQSKK